MSCSGYRTGWNRARWFLGGVAVIVVLVLAAPAGVAEPPPGAGPPAAAHLHVAPPHGPVGTSTTWSGLCGYPAAQISLFLSHADPDVNNGDLFTVHAIGPVPIPSTPLGRFSVALVIPAVGNVTIGVEPHWDLAAHPGEYTAAVMCDFIGNDPLFSSFEVTT
jgi:hypothetical protein